METPLATFLQRVEQPKQKERNKSFTQFHPYLLEIPQDLRNGIETLPNVRQCISMLEELEIYPHPSPRSLFISLTFAGLSHGIDVDKFGPGEHFLKFGRKTGFLYIDEWREQFKSRKEVDRCALVEFYCVVKAKIEDNLTLSNIKFSLDVVPSETSPAKQKAAIKRREEMKIMGRRLKKD